MRRADASDRTKEFLGLWRAIGNVSRGLDETFYQHTVANIRRWN
jgi:hypothetical protein